MKSLIQIQKKCEWCGSIFFAQKCSTRFCCKRCAEHAYKDRLRQQRVAKYKSENTLNEQQSVLEDVTEKDIVTHSTAIEGSTVTEIENQLLFDEGIRFRDYRLRLRMTRKEVSEAASIGMTTLYKFESGNMTYISFSTLFRLLRLIGLT